MMDSETAASLSSIYYLLSFQNQVHPNCTPLARRLSIKPGLTITSYL
jgi:hypothetical protein